MRARRIRSVVLVVLLIAAVIVPTVWARGSRGERIPRVAGQYTRVTGYCIEAWSKGRGGVKGYWSHWSDPGAGSSQPGPCR